jgi:hypothetical protein
MPLVGGELRVTIAALGGGVLGRRLELRRTHHRVALPANVSGNKNGVARH